VTLRLADDTLFSHRFGMGAPFRLGVEEELFLVDPVAHRVRACTDELLARLRRRALVGRVTGQLCDGVIELATPVCASADEVVATMCGLRTAVLADGGALLLGAGLHPVALFGDVRHRYGEHYEAVAQDTRGVLRQSTFCGVHVHVAMPDAETAIVAYNGMRKWVPLLQALGANSPFWHGHDSGLASARTVRVHDAPRSGLPRAFADWADYCDTMRELVRVADIDGVGSLWWDMRPHPRAGTLEVRVPDAQSSLWDLRGLVALIHCLTYHEAMVADPCHPPKELLDEASFQAIRDGLEARLSLGGPVQHVQALARQALDLAFGYAPALGCTEALRAVERLLADGNGADRQRRAFAAGGMDAVLAQLVAETCEPGPNLEPSGSPTRARSWPRSAPSYSPRRGGGRTITTPIRAT
jgi:glutamate---cysteine ligase / carboxylate-amine ligase